MKIHLAGSLGKYRDLLFAIAVFLVLDLGVLVFNFQSSRLIEADTHRIDLAGDMRVYSQQLAKAVLTLRQETLDGESTQTSVAQIGEAYAAYNQAIFRLKAALNGERREWFDDHARIDEARGLFDDLIRTWEPLSLTVKPLLDDPSRLQAPDVGMRVTIDIAATKMVARNIRLMQQADDLTRHLENMAVNRAGQMRTIQLAAIVLALINFVFIVFRFLRNLLRSDRIAAQATEEIARILGAIREGLFLIDQEGTIGSLQSESTAGLLGRKLKVGENLFRHLSSSMSPAEIKVIKNYVALMFSEQVSPELLGKLNPLRVFELKTADGGRRFLDVEFRPVHRGKRVECLLVSVSDITEKAGLADELARVRQTARIEVESLLSMLDHDPTRVGRFFEMAGQRLRIVNSQLRKFGASGASGAQLIAQIAAIANDIREESGVLGLHAIHSVSQTFESVLTSLAGTAQIDGNELLKLALVVDDLLEELDTSRKVVARLHGYTARKAPDSAGAESSSMGKVLA